MNVSDAPSPLFTLTTEKSEWLRAAELQESPGVPLFRYFSPHSFSLVEEERFPFCPPRCFNDPFELVPHIKFDNRQAAKHRVKKYLGTLTLRPTFLQLPRAERKKQLRALQKDQAKKWLASQQEFVQGLGNRFQNEFPWGIVCLSGTNRSLLMWAHYASSHTGFVVEFDTESPAFKRIGDLVRVKYCAERPFWDDDVRQAVSLEAPWFRTKSPEWSYEDEWRLFRPFAYCDRVENESGTRYFSAVPKSVIKAVYLGSRSNEALSIRAQKVLRVSGGRLFKAKLSTARFELQFDELTLKEA